MGGRDDRFFRNTLLTAERERRTPSTKPRDIDLTLPVLFRPRFEVEEGDDGGAGYTGSLRSAAQAAACDDRAGGAERTIWA
mmetsp:Transcript_29510/g.69600  ORF Transcript_29510/g.69600 Transcript_29510/m.69600 type:complete len:81 (+) Transcript_29510:348-590(+)